MVALRNLERMHRMADPALAQRYVWPGDDLTVIPDWVYTDETIYAREVELTLLDHPDIRDCAVIGLPDPDYGEKVAAAVVLGENRSVTDEELKRFVRERIAGFKTPRQFIFVQELPKTPSGKIQKHLVRPLFG